MTTLKKPKGLLLVISGSSGTGKGTVIAALRKAHPEFSYSVSATSREPRPGEIDGREYYFVSDERFEEMIRQGDVIEYTRYCGHYYGTPKSELAKLEDGSHLILEIEVEGGGNVKRLFPDCVSVFILPPDYETLKNRLVNRGTNTAADIEGRLNKALREFRAAVTYDYAVVNADGRAEEAAEAIAGIVAAELHRTARCPGAIDELFFSEKS